MIKIQRIADHGYYVSTYEVNTEEGTEPKVGEAYVRFEMFEKKFDDFYKPMDCLRWLEDRR